MSLHLAFSSQVSFGPSRGRGAVPSRRGVRPLGLFVVACALAALLGAAPASAAAPPPAAPLGSPAPPLALLAFQQAQFIAPDGAATDWLGYSVAIAGDTALVGAAGDAVGANADQGSAYVFVRSGLTWALQAKLVAGDGAAGDQFGSSVALDGDTALVGAPFDHVTFANQGSAYVFVRVGSGWFQQAQLTAADGALEDRFGYSVALAGDTALVGAPLRDVTFAHQGSAYVFTRAGTSWSQQAQLIAVAPAPGALEDRLGYSVALAGDSALVGAPLDDVGANDNQGSAYVFTRSGTSWTQQTQLTAQAPAAGAADDWFGYSVALYNDTALVGAPLDDISFANQGSATVFTRFGGVWSQQAQLTAAAGAANDEFGYSAALIGDRALVGAPFDDVGAIVNQGSASLFTRSGTVWSRQVELTAGGAPEDWFGYSVALAGDTALAGAPNDDVGTSADQGSAYAFVLDGVAPVTTASLAPPANSSGWNKTSPTVTLAASDATSGVAATEYRIAGAAAWTPYTAPFAVTTQGASIFEFRSTDKAGNVEATKTVTVSLDSSRPTTTAYKASVVKGKKVKLGYKVKDAVPGSAQATVTLKIFKGSTLKKTLKVGVRASNVKGTFSWKCNLAKGSYTIKVYGVDLAGNKQSKVGSATLTVR